jgi:hypothetical protein
MNRFFTYAIVCALLALWFWWLDRRNVATVKQLAAAEKASAKAEDDDDDDDEDDRYNQRRRRLLRAARMPLHGLAVVFRFAAIAFFVLSFFRTVSTGNASVPVTFGKAGKQLGPGLHVVWPITQLRNISVRTQSYTMSPAGDDPSAQVLGQDGTVANADATLLYRVNRSDVTKVYTNVGTGYSVTIVRPTTRTCVRAGFTKLPMVQAATVDFAQVERDIGTCIREKLTLAGIQVRDFQLRELRLSAQLQNAIDGQTAAKMLGISSPLDPKYLQYYYLQVLQRFAKNGANTVITGSNAPGVTFNLNGSTPSSSTTTTTTSPSGP